MPSTRDRAAGKRKIRRRLGNAGEEKVARWTPEHNGWKPHGLGPTSQRLQKGLRGFPSSGSRGTSQTACSRWRAVRLRFDIRAKAKCQAGPPEPGRSSITSQASGSVASTKPNSAPSGGRTTPAASASASRPANRATGCGSSRSSVGPASTSTET